jgi:hypothetical protein
VNPFHWVRSWFANPAPVGQGIPVFIVGYATSQKRVPLRLVQPSDPAATPLCVGAAVGEEKHVLQLRTRSGRFVSLTVDSHIAKLMLEE